MLWQRLKNVFRRREADATFFAELRATLLEADVAPELVAVWMDAVQPWKTAADVQRVLREQMLVALQQAPTPASDSLAAAPTDGPRVVLVVGVNGVGKTTTIAKLAHRAQAAGRRPLLVAADTFRAAAIDQLQIWGDRLNVPVVAQAHGADAAAVAFDGIRAAQARGCDLVLVDTAGRLHTKVPLMDELAKVRRVADKALPGAPHDCWCVLDAMTGQNSVAQVRQFHQALQLTGLIVAKYDGTARAGAMFTIAQQLHLPILYLGTGESPDALQPFDPVRFVATLS